VALRGVQWRIFLYSLLAFIAVSLLLYVGAMFGAPSPNTRVLMVTAFVGSVVTFWAWGFDRHREGKAGTNS
jgi:hypothetical protein